MIRRTALILPLLIVASSVSAQSADPLIGTWTLNVAKSKYDPGPAPKSSIVWFERAGDGVKVKTTTVDGQGRAITAEYTAGYDGKDYPASGSADYDVHTMKRIDQHRVEGTRKKAGKVVQSWSRVISKDGMTYTLTVTGVNAAGQKVNNTSVFEKQAHSH